MSRSPIRLVVFDLDDTLFDCLGQCVGLGWRPVVLGVDQDDLKARVGRRLAERFRRSKAHRV